MIWKDLRRPITIRELNEVRRLALNGKLSASSIGFLLDPPRSKSTIVKLCKREGIALHAKAGGKKRNQNAKRKYATKQERLIAKRKRQCEWKRCRKLSA